MGQVNYAQAVLRRWWLVAVLALAGLIVGSMIPVSHASKAHSWRTTALVGTVPPASGSKSTLGPGVNLSEVSFYAKSAQVMENAAKAAGVSVRDSKLKSTFTVVPPTAKKGQPGLVELAATASSRQASARLTNAYAQQLGAYLTQLVESQSQGPLVAAQQKVASLKARLAQLGISKAAVGLEAQLVAAEAQEAALSARAGYTGYNVLQPAAASTAVETGGKSSLASSHVTLGLLGILGGALLGAILAILAQSFDRTLASASRAEEAFGFRVVAEIPDTTKEDADPLISLIPSSLKPRSGGASGGVRAEAFQRLRMSVLLETLVAPSPSTANRQVILIVSPGTEPTRSAVVDNLAAVCADAGQTVLVVHTYGLHNHDDLGSDVEFPDVMTPGILQTHIQRSRLENVSLLPMGEVIGNSGHLLSRAPSLLNAARELSDLVIIEAPPLLAFHDGNALSSAADVVLVVGECGTTEFDAAHRAGELLRRINAPVLGVVLTNVHMSSKDLRQARASHEGLRSQLEPDRTPTASGGSSLSAEYVGGR